MTLSLLNETRRLHRFRLALRRPWSLRCGGAGIAHHAFPAAIGVLTVIFAVPNAKQE